MVVYGIMRKAGEDCKQLITLFLTKVMRIGEPISVIKAHRMGGALTSPIVMYLARPSIKGLVFSNLKNLKGIKSVEGN